MIQKHCGLTENNLVKSTWSGDIKKFQRKKFLTNIEQKKQKVKEGKMKLSEILQKKAICVKSMEVKNIIPGAYTYYQLKFDLTNNF